MDIIPTFCKKAGYQSWVINAVRQEMTSFLELNITACYVQGDEEWQVVVKVTAVDL
jgi:hypothetical protein